MESPQPAPPVNPTGLPPGVEVGGLGKRFLAHLIDRLVPALFIAAGIYLGPRVGGVEGFLIQVAAVVLTLAWALFVWWGFAVRAAGPGMRLMRLQLVGFYDGRPIGWMRFLLRALVLAALYATAIGLLLMLIFLVIHPRKQGWHDLLVHAVVIKQRALAPRKPRGAAEQRRQADAITPDQKQLAGTAAYGGQPHAAPQPLAPPAGVGGHSPVSPAAGPTPGAAQPSAEPYAGIVPGTESSGYQPAPTRQPERSGEPNPYSRPPTAERTAEPPQPSAPSGEPAWSGQPNPYSRPPTAERTAEPPQPPAPSGEPPSSGQPNPYRRPPTAGADCRTAPAAHSTSRRRGGSWRARHVPCRGQRSWAAGRRERRHAWRPAGTERVSRRHPDIALDCRTGVISFRGPDRLVRGARRRA